MTLALIVVVAFVLVAGCGGDDTGSPEGSWTLTGGVDLTGAEVLPTANFGEERVGGSTGCNRFNAPYAVEGEGLELGPIAATQIGCAPPASDREQAYLAALERVVAWRLEGSELVLLDDEDSELLRFTPT